MANWLYLRGERCFTARAEVRYRQPLPVGTPVRLEGRLLRRKGRVVLIEGKVFRQDNNTIVVEATGSYMLDG
jgi:acyl-coenzyme A thioesterase PaaI-like protein